MMAQVQPTRRRVKLERFLDAPIEAVWELWTTADGIEAWWGPEGFSVQVRSLDLRAGGELTYLMTAVGAGRVDFMKKAGMPVATETRITFTDVAPPRRLAYNTLADFIPGVEPYLVATEVDLASVDGRVRMTLTIEAMHDQHWTDMAVKGWESELDRLAVAVRTRA